MELETTKKLLEECHMGLLTMQEVAERLNVKYSTAMKWARTNYLPASKLGRVYRISEEALNAFIEQKKAS